MFDNDDLFEELIDIATQDAVNSVETEEETIEMWHERIRRDFSHLLIFRFYIDSKVRNDYNIMRRPNSKLRPDLVMFARKFRYVMRAVGRLSDVKIVTSIQLSGHNRGMFPVDLKLIDYISETSDKLHFIAGFTPKTTIQEVVAVIYSLLWDIRSLNNFRNNKHLGDFNAYLNPKNGEDFMRVLNNEGFVRQYKIMYMDSSEEEKDMTEVYHKVIWDSFRDMTLDEARIIAEKLINKIKQRYGKVCQL